MGGRRAVAAALPPRSAPRRPAGAPAPPGTFALPGSLAPPPAAAVVRRMCLTSGDGYLRARLAGALEARIDWSN